MAEPGFWDDPVAARAVIGEVKELKGRLAPYERLAAKVAELAELAELLEAEPDPGLEAEWAREVAALGPELERLEDPEEMEEVEAMIRRHLEYTGSEVAKRILARWDRAVARFVKVMPKDYKRALAALAGAGGEEGVMAAFEANKRDLLRVSGN